MISLIGSRGGYRIDFDGANYVIQGHGQRIVSPGDTIQFSNGSQYTLKNSTAILDSGTSHIEGYTPDVQHSNADWIRTGADWVHGSSITNSGNHVVTGYVNLTEVTGVGDWDPHWNRAWDTNNDDRIDVPNSQLPSWLNSNNYNADWGNYIAQFWNPEWKQILFQKIDYVMAKNFDGVVFDQVTNWSAMLHENPNALAEMAQLMREVSNYIHNTYGNTAVVSFNVDSRVLLQNPDLMQYMDAGYQQNSTFNWWGDGNTTNVDSIGAMRSLFSQNNMPLYTMDHVNHPNANHYQHMFDTAINNGYTPMLTDVHMQSSTQYAQFNFGTVASNVIRGNAGQNYMWGDDGNDTMIGGDGYDIMRGGEGQDIMYGNRDLDIMDGGNGNDAIYLGQNAGQPGADGIRRAGVEFANGGNGNDTIFGNMGADYMNGNAGNDVLYGGQDSDTLIGEDGSDTLFGNRGDDVYIGGNGPDTFVFQQGNDTVMDFGPGDRIQAFDPMTAWTISGNSTTLHFGINGSITLLGVQTDPIGWLL